MDSVSNPTSNTTPAIDLTFSDFIKKCFSKWFWYAAAIVFFVGIAFAYVKHKEPVFERIEQLLVKDEDSNGMSDFSSAFSSFGFGMGNTSVYNELISITSPAVIYETAKRLDLDMTYIRKGGFYPITLYGNNQPFKIVMKGLDEQQAGRFRMTVHPDGSGVMYKFVRFTPDGKEKYDDEVNFSNLNQTVKTPLGEVKIESNPGFTGESISEDTDIVVTKSAMQDAVEHYCEQLNGEVVDRDADVIGLSIRDVNVQRAVDILNTVLQVYTEYWIEDKNKVAVATSKFIEDRLQLIQQELGDVDTNIARYQASTGTPSIAASAQVSLDKEAALDVHIAEYQTQISIAEGIGQYLTNPENSEKVVPVNIGMENAGLEKQLAEFNNLILSRDNLLQNSSVNNPIVKDYDTQIAGMRAALVKSVDAQIKSLESQLKTANRERSKAMGEMVSTPAKVLPLLSEERQQKVKEALYLFLLQKREENELSQQFTANNIRVITPPMGSLKPVAPKKMLILGVASILALLVPTVILYLKITGDTKVRSKKDFERVKMPFAGEIPLVGKNKLHSDLIAKLKKQKEETAPLAVVAEGKRDVVNEAFRVIRSNLDFMRGKDMVCQVVMITSFNPGSGKSFISYNLGMSFALKKKRALLIDCDLRHGSTSMYVSSPKKGLTNYLTDQTNDWKSLTIASTENRGLEILPVGKMPPNPAELFENGRLATLIEEAKKDFDIILLDCPPVNIVADTQIVAPLADSTIFVVRAGLLDKNALPELNEFYEQKKFKNMSLILNGTEAVHSRYYTYGNYQSFAE